MDRFYLVFVEVFLRNLVNNVVNRVVGECQKKWLVPFGFQKLNGFIGENIGEVAFGIAFVAVVMH